MRHRFIRGGKRSLFSKDTLNAIINTSDVCNFNCSYCINKKFRTNRILPKNVLTKFIEDLSIRNHEKYIIQLTGGEPLIYPYRKEVIKAMDIYIKPSDKTLLFVTNAFYLNTNGIELYKHTQATKIKFWISVHSEQMDLKEYINRILRFPRPRDLFVSILLSPGKLEKYKMIIDKLTERCIPYTCTAIVGEKDTTITYSNEEMEFLLSLPYNNKELFFHEHLMPAGEREIISISNMEKKFQHTLFNYKDYYCLAGRNSMRLDPGGNLARCFGFLRKGEKFNLNNKRLRDIPEFSHPCICPVEYCGQCDIFLEMPKWQLAEDAPDYIKCKTLSQNSLG